MKRYLICFTLHDSNVGVPLAGHVFVNLLKLDQSTLEELAGILERAAEKDHGRGWGSLRWVSITPLES